MKKSICLFLILIQFYLSYSQSINTNQFNALIEKYATEHSIVGLSIGTIYKGKIETNSFGRTSYDSNIQITESTLFNVASITKLFTATAIMQLVEENKLSLDEKVYEILPAFKMKDKRYKQITVAHLLTHSSGLMWDNKLKNSPDNRTSIPQYLRKLENKKLQFDPGTKMSYMTYSNVAFDLLGIIIEKITGQSYAKYIFENQLKNIGITKSTFQHEKIDHNLLALPQVVAGSSRAIKKFNLEGIDRKRNPIINGEPLKLATHHSIGEDFEHNPSGNLLSSTKELIQWVDEIMNINNQSSSTGIIEKESLNQMWGKNYLASGDNLFIGLGWWIKEDEKYGRSYFHVGTNPGYCSILMIYPEMDLGIVILSNGWYGKEMIWNKLFYKIVEMHYEK